MSRQPTYLLSAIVIWCLLVCSTDLAAQDKRYTEEQVTIEKLFIEAKKHKLLGDQEAAADLFKQILSKYRNHDVAAYELAGILHEQKEYEDGLHHINLALGIDGSNKWYLLLKADIQEDAERFGQAAYTYERLTELFPRDIRFLERKAYLYSRAENHARAIEILDEMEDRSGITEKTSLIKHDLYKRQGKKKQALDELKLLTEALPQDTKIKHILATYYKQINKPGQAEDVYRQILEIDPQDARANVALASTFKKQGNHSSYLNSIKPIIENEQADIDVKIAELMPYIRRLQKQNDQSELVHLLELVNILEKTHPRDPKAFAIHGDVLSLVGRHDEAIERYKQTLELDESNYLVWEQMLMSMAEVRQLTDLARYSNEAMDLFPNQAMLYYLHGLAQVDLKAYDLATDALEQALMMSGRNKELRLSILALQGKAYYAQGDYDRSDAAYEKALLLEPNDPRILNDFSYHLATRGADLAQAEMMVDKALGQDRENPRYLATKAWIFYRQGKPDPALKTMETALANGGDQYAFILENMGDILYTLDQKDKAVRYWKSARDQGEGSKWLDRKIEEERLIEAQ